MGFRNREKENKYLVLSEAAPVTLKMANKRVRSALKSWRREIMNDSNDVYWHPPESMNIDYVRVRYMPEGGGMMTIKHTDKKDITDRVEIDVWVEDPDQAVAFWKYAAGKPAGLIHKRYYVYFFDKEGHDTVSIYQVTGDDRVFVETEGTTSAKAKKYARIIGEHLHLKQIEESLYTIFFGGKNGKRKTRNQSRRVPASRKAGAQGKRKVRSRK